MIDFLYTRDYSDEPSEEEASEIRSKQQNTLTNVDDDLRGLSHHSATTSQLINISVYQIADKYDLGGLKVLAKSKFMSRSSDTWKDGLVSVLGMIYQTTPASDRGLRDQIMPVCLNQ